MTYNKIKAVIFDMDGVLIDAKEWHYEALNKSLGLFGMEISRYDHLVTYDGLPTRKKLEMLTRERGLPVALHSFLNEIKQQYTMDIVYSQCKPIFYHQYALARLKNEGYRIAVCSNSIRETIRVMMEKSCLMENLDFYLSNEDVKKAKPDPEMYLTAIGRLELTPAECIIVEDNEHGVQAARASGAHVLKVGTVQDVTYQNVIAKVKEVEHSC